LINFKKEELKVKMEIHPVAKRDMSPLRQRQLGKMVL
jgi:hypothetical protein